MRSRNRYSRTASSALSLFVFTLICASPAQAQDALTRLRAELPGEYNNNEQVWQQELDKVALSPRVHMKLSDHTLAGAEQGVFILDAKTADEETAQAWRLIAKPAATVLTVHGWKLSTSQSQRADCHSIVTCASEHGEPEIRLELNPQGFTDQKHTPANFTLDGEVLRIAPHLLGWQVPNKALALRRVRQFTGWISLKRQHIDASAAEDDYIFMKDVKLHNEGARVQLVDEDGTPTGYTVELARLTYQRTRTAILKIGIIEDASDYTLSYAWASVGATRVGINLRWIQAGFTAVAK